MRFQSVCVSLAALAASTKALTITNPSSAGYWVQFSTNTIAWSLSSGDPTDVTLQVVNTNTTTLNGVFPIAEFIKASLESYTVTNVTLVTADGYMVRMVNPTNNSQIYATSGTFSVRPSGTTPPPVTGPSGHTGSNSTGVNGTSGSTSGRNGTTTGSSFGNGTANGNARSSSAGKINMPAAIGVFTLASAVRFAFL